MFKKIIIPFIAIASVALLPSCKKQNDVAKPTEGKNPIAEIMDTFVDSNADFYVTVSSSYGVSVYGAQASSKQPSTIIEAYSKNESNVGTLTVNNMNIPFNNKSYFRQCDTSTFLPSMVVGVNNTYNLTGGSFPSFNIQQYSPNYSTLNFTGLVDKKLPRETSLTVSWNPDGSMPKTTAQATILIYSEDTTTHLIKSVSENVNDGDGTYTIPKSVLDQFSVYSYVRVLYFRGYNAIHTINNKNVDINFITFSYSWINFAN